MANEKRLIDANSLIEKFNDHKDLFLNKMGGFQALLQREKGRVDELDNCIADVINAPTVDAVEVVRCKDCEYWKPGDSFGGDSLDDMQRIGGCPIMRFARRENDFCCEGKRKNDG